MSDEVKPQIVSIDEDSLYCPTCGGCGYIGCCGVRDFLEKHVKGKTDCPQEAIFIDEMIRHFEEYQEEVNKVFEQPL